MICRHRINLPYLESYPYCCNIYLKWTTDQGVVEIPSDLWGRGNPPDIWVFNPDLRQKLDKTYQLNEILMSICAEFR